MRLEFQSITKTSVQNSLFIGDLFLIEVSGGLLHPLDRCQRVKLNPARVFTRHKFLGAYMRLELKNITALSVQNSMFIGELFLIEVSDG